jgi:predicted transcriptional regulator
MTYTEKGNTILSIMKTVTIKADAEFDALLSRLAGRLSTTRSRVIRDAVKNYQQYLDREELRQKIRAASLKTRAQALDESAEFDIVNADGL